MEHSETQWRLIKCPKCKGTKEMDCPPCDGQGDVEVECWDCFDTHFHDCKFCDTEGKVACEECDAEGLIIVPDFALENQGQIVLALPPGEPAVTVPEPETLGLFTRAMNFIFRRQDGKA